MAKSIYTDKEVFVRELLSNCRDALEKQRFKEMKGDLALLLMNRNEKVALEYFDYLTWVEAQILSMPYGELRKTNYNSALGK